MLPRYFAAAASADYFELLFRHCRLRIFRRDLAAAAFIFADYVSLSPRLRRLRHFFFISPLPHCHFRAIA